MLYSKVFGGTLREDPAEAEIVSHRLMLRAGLMRRTAAGIYTYLPLGYRVLRKIMRIVREEMDAAGGQEILLPIIQPAEIWHESGRWNDYGEEMFKLKDRHGRQFCLGPTHEEITTVLVRGEVSSYRQLPLRLYQIQNKYRDEIRPRFGVIRGREFIMKDLYSFDADEEGLDKAYKDMYQAYCRVFDRCGVKTLPVEADSGAIGGDETHEFMVLADSGEATVVVCGACGYAANVEKAASAKPEKTKEQAGASGEPREVETPDQRSIDEVCGFLRVPAHILIKSLIYLADDQPVMALVRGDHELNEIKLQQALQCQELAMADEQTVQRLLGVGTGYVGPIGLPEGVKVVADAHVMSLSSAVTGANREGYHLTDVVPGRDFTPDLMADIRLVGGGDACPSCGRQLTERRGIEVGQIFKLGTKYSAALGATYLDENGESHPLVMGCYGIGVSRLMAACIEANHDEDGIIWPAAIAPYHVVIVPIGKAGGREVEVASELYQALLQRGVEVIMDDRDERPGVKFKDADLIGLPWRITVGRRTLDQGQIEITTRATRETRQVPVDQAVSEIEELLQQAGIQELD